MPFCLRSVRDRRHWANATRGFEQPYAMLRPSSPTRPRSVLVLGDAEDCLYGRRPRGGRQPAPRRLSIPCRCDLADGPADARRGSTGGLFRDGMNSNTPCRAVAVPGAWRRPPRPRDITRGDSPLPYSWRSASRSPPTGEGSFVCNQRPSRCAPPFQRRAMRYGSMPMRSAASRRRAVLVCRSKTKCPGATPAPLRVSRRGFRRSAAGRAAGSPEGLPRVSPTWC